MSTHKHSYFHSLTILLLMLGFSFVFTGRAAPTATIHTVCAAGCNFSSIQAAIEAAASGDTISLAGEVFTETFYVDGKELTIQGAGADQTIVQAAGTPGTASNRVVTIYAAAKVTLTGVTIRHGVAPDPGPGFASLGGGIYNVGTLTLTQSVVTANQANNGGGIININSQGLTVSDSTISNNTGSGIYNYSSDGTIQNSKIIGNHAGNGGGIYNEGDSSSGGLISVVGSVFTDNQANIYGGGIYGARYSTTNVDSSTISANEAMAGGGMYGPSFIVTNSTIYGNTSRTSGGGIYGQNGTVTITNTTISQNSADHYGGGITNGNGNLNITHSTISGNSASLGRAGLYNATAFFSVNLRNSLIADNLEGDCYNSGIFNDLGYNLVQDGSCIDDPTSFAADPMLGSLQDNGGNTLTHALLPGSPAIDAIPVAACDTVTDQRGVSRPQGEGCDIGAFEVGSNTASRTLFIPYAVK